MRRLVSKGTVTETIRCCDVGCQTHHRLKAIISNDHLRRELLTFKNAPDLDGSARFAEACGTAGRKSRVSLTGLKPCNRLCLGVK